MQPKPSYEAINYSIRPAKSIERKMFIEACRLLHPFGDLNSYSYVGFGSTFFSDFALVHRALGISDLMSIEKDADNADRFDFNRPFNCIKLIFKTSTEALPKDVNWKKKTIMWLDYDGRLTDSVLADVSFFCDLAVSGSVLIASVQANPDRKERLSKLRRRVDPTKVPAGIDEDYLQEWGTARAYYRIISNEIQSALTNRNGTKDADHKLEFKQLFHFIYADGAKMLTVGGVLHEARDRQLFDRCQLSEQLEFIRTGPDPYHLVAPSLTLREVQHLDKQLPCASTSGMSAKGISAADLEHYRRVYRYFPRFAEAELT
jgi:putative O-methyltransferase